MDKMRLQKYMAKQGVASRRKSEEIILAGRVKVNGHLVTTLGSKLDPQSDLVTVDDKRIGGPVTKVYILLNKPKGYVTTTKDPQGRKTVLDLVSKIKTRIYPVGRLDYNTEGLLILTNDGDLTQLLTHPSSQIKKTYQARVEGLVTDEKLEALSKGVDIGDYKTAPAQVYLLSKDKESSLVEITIHEGKYHQVKRMFEAVGLEVKRLVRTQIASMTRKKIPRGGYRHLKKSEVDMLYARKKARKSSAYKSKNKGGHHGKR